MRGSRPKGTNFEPIWKRFVSLMVLGGNRQPWAREQAKRQSWKAALASGIVDIEQGRINPTSSYF